MAVIIWKNIEFRYPFVNISFLVSNKLCKDSEELKYSDKTKTFDSDWRCPFDITVAMLSCFGIDFNSTSRFNIF